VLAACKELTEHYGDTLTARGKRDTIDALYREAELDRFAVVIPKKFRGDVERLKDGRWKFHWDFSGEDQLKDFERAPHVYSQEAKAPKISRGALVLKGIDVVVPVTFKGAPLRIEYKLTLLDEKAPHGYGRVVIFPLPRKGTEGRWEFACCHADRRRKDAPDFFRNIYTFGGGVEDCWQQPYPAGRFARRIRHRVKIEITQNRAKAWFDSRLAYDSTRVRRHPGEKPDPAALPDLSRLYRVQFSGWHPDDTWTFDDITITGPVDSDWLKAVADEQRP